MDGCCRHMIATLFEVLDFTQDFNKKTVVHQGHVSGFADQTRQPNCPNLFL